MANLEQAAVLLGEHEHRHDGGQITDSLSAGLNLLADLLFTRIHADVEKQFGMDSMLAPVSEMKSEMAARNEIDAFLVAEAAVTARDRDFVADDDQWFLKWLAELQMGPSMNAPGVAVQLATYWARPADARRLHFAERLEHVVPEARRAPLVLYRLAPLAAAITTCVAFGDRETAQELRREQLQILPGVADCPECRGRLLGNEDQCRQCGNPLWKYAWLTSV